MFLRGPAKSRIMNWCGYLQRGECGSWCHVKGRCVQALKDVSAY